MSEPITNEDRKEAQKWASIFPPLRDGKDWLHGYYEALVVQLEEQVSSRGKLVESMASIADGLRDENRNLEARLKIAEETLNLVTKYCCDEDDDKLDECTSDKARAALKAMDAVGKEKS